MTPLQIAFALLLLCTGAIALATRRLSRHRERTPHDRSSMVLGAAHGLSLAAAIAFPWLHLGTLPAGPTLGWIGIAILLAGFSLQLVAVLTLGGLYTLSLAAHPDQDVVARGPYRWVRHPGYLGQMVFWLGFALATANALVIGVIVLADSIAYPYRIRTEELLLNTTLGAPYRRYAAHTHRLLPYVW